MDVGCYPVNVARWVFGAEPDEDIGRKVAYTVTLVPDALKAVNLRPSDGCDRKLYGAKDFR
jgi:hypothetical protein